MALVILLGGGFYFLERGPLPQFEKEKESLNLENDLISLELTQEEEQVLQNEGIASVSEEDAQAEALQTVRSSDELFAIEADLNETNISGLDAELELIQKDLSGL